MLKEGQLNYCDFFAPGTISQHLIIDPGGIIDVTLTFVNYKQQSDEDATELDPVLDATKCRRTFANLGEGPQVGRLSSGLFNQKSKSPLANSHQDIILSLQNTPICAGGNPPRYPADLEKDKYVNPALRKQRQQFASYVMTNFCAWSIWDENESMWKCPYAPTWDGFSTYMKDLTSPQASFLNKSMYRIIVNLARATTTNPFFGSHNRKLISAYRNKGADFWTEDDIFDPSDTSADRSGGIHIHGDEFDVESGGIGSTTNEDRSKTLKEIDKIRSMASVDSESQLKALQYQAAQSSKQEQTINMMTNLYSQVNQQRQELQMQNLPRSNSQTSNSLVYDSCNQEENLSLDKIYNGLKSEVKEKAIEIPSEDILPRVNMTESNLPGEVTSVETTLNEDSLDVRKAGEEFKDIFIKFGSSQKKAMKIIKTTFESHIQGIKQMLILLTGPPGAGKTFLLQGVQSFAASKGFQVNFYAPTGAAARLLPGGGDTLHHGLLFSDMKGKKKDPTISTIYGSARNTKLGSASINKYWKDQKKEFVLIVVDEAGLVSDAWLYHISCRFQDLVGGDQYDKPFGGLPVIIVEDPFQMEPVIGKSIIGYSLLEYCKQIVDKSYTSPYFRDNGGTLGAHYRGVEIFTQFRHVELVGQNRCVDLLHLSIIELLRLFPTRENPVSVSKAVIDYIRSKQITAKQMVEDDAYQNAPVLVTNHQTRCIINEFRMQQFALKHNEVFVTWKQPMKGNFVESLSHDKQDQLYKDFKVLSGSFCRGAPGMIKQNVSTLKGVTNGCTGTMVGLSFRKNSFTKDYSSEAKEKIAEIARARPGSHVDLGFESPEFFLFEVEVTRNYAFLDHEIVERYSRDNISYVVIAIPVNAPTMDSFSVKQYFGMSSKIRKENSSISYFPCWIDPFFACTFEKIQGATTPKLIADFGNVGSNRQLTLEALYVALTRVKQGIDFSILPLSSDGDKDALAYLQDFRRPFSLQCWCSAYDKEGTFQSSLFLAELEKIAELETELSIKKRNKDSKKSNSAAPLGLPGSLKTVTAPKGGRGDPGRGRGRGRGRGGGRGDPGRGRGRGGGSGGGRGDPGRGRGRGGGPSGGPPGGRGGGRGPSSGPPSGPIVNSPRFRYSLENDGINFCHFNAAVNALGAIFPILKVVNQRGEFLQNHRTCDHVQGPNLDCQHCDIRPFLEGVSSWKLNERLIPTTKFAEKYCMNSGGIFQFEEQEDCRENFELVLTHFVSAPTGEAFTYSEHSESYCETCQQSFTSPPSAGNLFVNNLSVRDNTFMKALQSYYGTRILHGIKCSVCAHPVPKYISKTVLSENGPISLFYINRFMNFNATRDKRPFLIPDKIPIVSASTNTSFANLSGRTLMAFVAHTGNTLKSGHFFSFVRLEDPEHNNELQWFQTHDNATRENEQDAVERVTDEDALKFASTQAVILIYCDLSKAADVGLGIIVR